MWSNTGVTERRHYKWNQYKFSLKWIMRHKRLWYLLDTDSVKFGNGDPVSREVQEQEADVFCAILMESIHEDHILLIEDCSTPKEMWEALRD